MWTHLIWDFNGTLYDDVEAGVKSINVLLTARGLPPLPSVEAYRDHFGFPIETYYRALGLDVDGEGFDALAHEWMEQYLLYSQSAGVREGVEPVLRELTARGIRQLVLSASERRLLLRQLDELGIAHYFETVLGLDNIYAHSKVEIAEQWHRKNPDAIPLFVGDTLHDAEVAAAIDADCVLITGGHHDRARLAMAGVPVIDSFDELLTLPGLSRK